MKIAVFPGSFDPFTKGHEDLVTKALPLFDKIYIAVGINNTKTSFFPLDKRLAWIADIFQTNKVVEVVSYQGLTVDFCQSVEAKFIIRGVRNSIDFQIEKDIAQANKQLAPDIETLFFSTSPQYAHLSSSIVRDLFLHNGDYSPYVSVILTK
ncbi:MAG: pantetheine-phosphate adenylyltransferase [Bacteroidales bacterium]